MNNPPQGERRVRVRVAGVCAIRGSITDSEYRKGQGSIPLRANFIVLCS